MRVLLAALCFASTLAQADCSSGFVRLTVDDGPNALYTSKFLDILHEKNVKATFFVIGSQIADNREVLIRTVIEGHKIGNHTWSHAHLPDLEWDEQVAELAKTSAAIKHITGFSPTEWRPPYEEWNQPLREEASRQGMNMALWSYETDSNDWKGIAPELIAETIVTNAKHGSTILMHDTYKNTLDALPLVLDGLAKKNLCTIN